MSLRWLFASLIEGVLGLGTGAITMFPIGISLGQTNHTAVIISLIFLTILALLIWGAHAIIMRPVVRYWRLWGCIDGTELMTHWLIVFLLVRHFGFFYGVLASSNLCAGLITASMQAVLLRERGNRVLYWVIGSALAWLCAGILSTWVEIYLNDPVLSVVYGVAVGRFIFGIVSSPVFGWIFTKTDGNTRP